MTSRKIKIFKNFFITYAPFFEEMYKIGRDK